MWLYAFIRTSTWTKRCACSGLSLPRDMSMAKACSGTKLSPEAGRWAGCTT